MTDEDLPERSPAGQFMTRRQRREYERAQEHAQYDPDAQRRTHGEQDVEATDDARDDGASSESDTPQPLAAGGPGGLRSTPHRPNGQPQDQVIDRGRYAREQNIDLGRLQPLPHDTRDYPDLAEDVAAHTPEEVSADQDADEQLLGYMLVADGTQQPPEMDEAALKTRKTRKRRRTLVMLTSFGLFLGLLAIVGIGVSQLVGWTNNDYPGPGGEEIQFEVNRGEGAIVIGNRLVEQDIVASTGAFRDAVEAAQSTSEIQPGEYMLRYEMPARDAASVLLEEDALGMHYVAVNSGHRIDDVYENIADQTSYSVEEIEEAADPANFDLPTDASTLEGYIAVGEYRFPIDATLEEVLDQMIQPTMEEFDRLEIRDPQEQFRLVTIASIVEAEARAEDFAVVAGIIENRLDPANSETAGFLQIDATVIYGMGVRQLQFTAEDRQDESNEYNTYAHRGLPPGPIGAPSIAALDAAADPEDSEYYYWITTNIETGETHFSTTLEQHLEYQQEYRQYCDDNPDICGG